MRVFSSTTMRKLLLLALVATGRFASHAQGVGIGTTAPDASAALDIVSSSKGALLPRVANVTAIANPATGLIAFQTGGTAGYYYNAGTAAAPSWQQLATAVGATQTLNLNGQSLSISGGNTVTLPTTPGDNLGNHLATQTLNLQNNALTGSGADIGAVMGVGVRADGGLNLGQNTTGNSIYLGYQAGRVSTSYDNVFSGYQSGYSNSAGYDNAFVGYQSGYSNTTGHDNVFSGSYSGYNTTTGAANLFSGTQSGYNTTTGDGNLFSGYRSGYANTTGFFNVSSGSYSGQYNTTGYRNTSLGYNSGPANGSGTINNATAVGAEVALTQSNTVVLGNNANVGIGTSTPTYKLDVSGTIRATGSITATTYNTTSDQRLKTDVRPLTGALASVLALRGVRYHWNALGIQRGGRAKAEQVGLLAQELERVYPELVSTGPDGYKAVNYAQLTPVLIEALKEQQAQIEALQARATSAEADHASLLTLQAQMANLLGNGAQAQK
jgi:hypothetical protein